MRRASRILSIAASALIVWELSVLHANTIAERSYPLTGTSRIIWICGYILLIAVATYTLGLPDQPSNWRQASGLALVATGIGALGISVIQLATGDALLPRFVVFGAALVNVPVQIIINAIARIGRSRAEDRDRILLIAAAGERERMADDLRLAPERAASLAATMSPDEVVKAPPGSETLIDRMVSSEATMIVLDHSAQSVDLVVSQAAKLHESGVRVRTLQRFYEEWLGKLPLDELERASLLFDIGEVHSIQYARLKRILDVSLALVGIAILVVITPLVFVGNIVGNRGPLIFKQTRVGKGGSNFTILKFRTMKASPGDSTGSSSIPEPGQWTTESDPRITPLGRVLRKTHMDELPQMINILRGDLSIVGPRPEQPHYVAELSEKLAFYNLRHLVRPGLTGWAQVKYGYAGDEMDALEKLQYEFYYLRRQDIAFDIRIILRTLRSIVGGQGAGR